MPAPTGCCVSAKSNVRFSERHRDGRALARRALELELRAVILRRVLDDGQAEARPADLAGMALIDPIKPLKDAFLMRLRDSDVLYSGSAVCFLSSGNIPHSAALDHRI